MDPDLTALTGRTDDPGATTPFAIIPEWLLYQASEGAVVTYAILDRHRNEKTGRCAPSITRLAAMAGVSVPTMRRRLSELEKIGAVIVAPTYRPDGSQTSNQYRLVRDPEVAQMTRPPITVDPPSPVTDGGARNESKQEREKDLSPVGPRPQVVDHKPVAPDHAVLAAHVLGEWNQQTGQKLKSREWLGKIVMRIRENPDLTAEDHAHVIHSALADPWWKGAPTPSVVYGNGAQFERCMEQARSGPAKPKAPARKYGYGVTAAEILSSIEDPEAVLASFDPEPIGATSHDEGSSQDRDSNPLRRLPPGREDGGGDERLRD